MKVSDLEVSGVTTPQDMERRVLCFHRANRIYELSKDKDPVGLLKDLEGLIFKGRRNRACPRLGV